MGDLANSRPRARPLSTVKATRADGSHVTFNVVARVDSPIEVDYLRHGGILQMVLRSMTQS